MLNAMWQGQGQAVLYYATPGQIQPAMDFTEPHAQQQQLEGMQPVPAPRARARGDKDAHADQDAAAAEELASTPRLILSMDKSAK